MSGSSKDGKDEIKTSSINRHSLSTLGVSSSSTSGTPGSDERSIADTNDLLKNMHAGLSASDQALDVTSDGSHSSQSSRLAAPRILNRYFFNFSLSRDTVLVTFTTYSRNFQ